MTSGMMKFSDVESKNANPANLRDQVSTVLKAKDDACSDAILPYMTTPGITGSREYDHANAVRLLLDYDSKDMGGNGAIASIMVKSNISQRMLWDVLVKVYRKAGFRVYKGRVVGLLEDQSNSDSSSPAEDNDSVE